MTLFVYILGIIGIGATVLPFIFALFVVIGLPIFCLFMAFYVALKGD